MSSYLISLRGRRVALVLSAAAISLSACSSSETAGELVNQPSSNSSSSEVQPVAGDRDPELLALMQEVNLDPCPSPVLNPDAAIPGLPDQIFDCLGDTSAVSLAQVRGTPMVVNVWASWCPPCIEELPLLNKVSRELEGKVDFIGINLEDDPTKALQLMQDFGISYPSVIDRSGDTRAPLMIPGPPVTFFVTAQGVIASRWDGAIPNEKTFNSLLQKHLGITR
jgi:cytochrome c biogenesis protein CcmG, thiol:disulfide interchange protein DsbE